MKYRHMLGETLGLDGPQISLLAVLMLRGAQTPGELRQRTERLHRFGEDGARGDARRARGRELVRLLPRRPGQREQRYEQLLGEGAEPAGAEPAAAPEAPAAPRSDGLGPSAWRASRRSSPRCARSCARLREELGRVSERTPGILARGPWHARSGAA